MWPAPCSRRRTLKAGEYRFARPASVLEVYDRIARGDIFYYLLTVREGENIFDIAAAAKWTEALPGRGLPERGA